MRTKNQLEHLELVECILSATDHSWKGGEGGGYNILDSKGKAVMKVWSEGQAVAIVSLGEILRCASNPEKVESDLLVLVQDFLR
ncbi:MAG: hypothetical protein WC087_00910 [Candidatus Paceibacterota bacterium]